jgi:hypothetical protein
MDGVAAGSRRVGPFEHGRFGAGLTISLDLVVSGGGTVTSDRAAYLLFHWEGGFMAHRTRRHEGPTRAVKEFVEKELKKL